MKKKLMLILGLLFLVFFIQGNLVHAKTNQGTIVYFYDSENKNQAIDDEINKMIDKDEVQVIKYNIRDTRDPQYEDPFNVLLLKNYKEQYHVQNETTTPLIFSGGNYYDKDTILTKVEEIKQNASSPLLYTFNDFKAIVYFYSPGCSNCNETEPYIENLEKSGIQVVWYDVTRQFSITQFDKYSKVYSVPKDKKTTPMVFAGDHYYHSKDTIISHLNDIKADSQHHLKNINAVEESKNPFSGFLGFLLVLGAGLLDGVNPCAMAMLVLFISLLIGMSSKRSTLISVCIAYIFGLFITYFALGIGLLSLLEAIQPVIAHLTFYIDVFIVAFSLFLFFFNLYDFIVTKKEEFGKVKNQLPKGIQRFNKKLIGFFTRSLENKNLIVVYLISFVLGVIISLTEFLCTGQIYLPVILSLTHSVGSIIKLFLYNIMFVLPLIILAVGAVKAQSVMSTSNTIREKMYLIKLATSLLFLVIAIYYILKLFGVM